MVPRVLIHVCVLGLVAACACGQEQEPEKLYTPFRESPTAYPVYGQEHQDQVAEDMGYLLLDITMSSIFAADSSLNDPEATAEYVAKAKELLLPLLVEPELASTDLWRQAADLAIATDDASLAAFAHEALSKNASGAASADWQPELLEDLAELPIQELLAQIPEDRVKFYEAIDAARNQGDPAIVANAKGVVGWYYSVGQAVPRCDSEALHWFRMAADEGDAEGMRNLGFMMREGRGCAKDSEGAFGWIQKSAERGYDAAMYELAMSYEQGVGVVQDQDMAVKWYKKAADERHTAAMARLGEIYQQGLGVERDIASAKVWIKMAAVQGDPRAMFNLGVMSFEGNGVKQDVGHGMAWMIKAAEAGNVHSMWILAQIYSTGTKVDVNMGSAMQWLHKAAEHDHPDALYELAVKLYNGTDIEQDQDEAIRLIERAAALGNAGAIDAMKQMGR